MHLLGDGNGGNDDDADEQYNLLANIHHLGDMPDEMTKSFDDDDTKEPDLYQIYETHFGDPKTASETGRLPGELFGRRSPVSPFQKSMGCSRGHTEE